uniref:Inter-alpha-trypsin inhibitor heavy chain H3 n=1 Tax=Gadus morhua TaxID=8049 RepID=A0A8C5B5A2_GADMO
MTSMSKAPFALLLSRSLICYQCMYFVAHSVQMVEVLSVKLHCTVASRFAHTVMTSTALNKANSSQEIFFEVDLPKTAFITNFSMEIEGQIYVGVVNEKEQAKKQYEKAVSSGRTAGLVKASGRKMEKFSVSVNIAAKSNVTFILTYEELLQRKFGKYEILTRINPKQLVQNFQIVADIYEPQGIAFVDAHATFLSNELLPLVEKTVTDNKAHISFSPTLDQQRKCPECDGSLINGDFIIKYDVKRASSLGDIQIVNGYFVHFFAPPDLPRIRKNVMFVIDRSWSMSGTRMVQSRLAMESILSDVHPEDYFGIILFDDRIEPWKESLTKATEENVDEAIKFVRQISPRGATNINDAVIKAIHMLQDDRRNKKLPERSVDMIILLTDGINLQRIQQNVCKAIGGNMTLFCLGFGDDVDYSFLDVMAKQNNGVARRIYEASDATLQLQGFYDEVASPLLSAVDLRYPDNAVDSLTPHHFSQLFNGSEIVVAGRLSENDMDNFLVEVFANGGGLEVTTEYITLHSDSTIHSISTFSPNPSVDLLLTKDRSVKVTLRDSVKFDYLGFYTLDSHLLSPSVHGLLGNEQQGINIEVGDLRPGEVPEKPDATMYVKGHQLNVTRILKRGKNVPCWFIHSNGTGSLMAVLKITIVSGLFKTVWTSSRQAHQYCGTV